MSSFADQAGFELEPPRKITALRVVMWIFIVLTVAMIITSIVWASMYKSTMGYGDFLSMIITKIWNIAIWPIKLLMSMFGFGGDAIPIPIPIPQLPLPPAPTLNTVVTKHEITTCPPCQVDVKCPPCDDNKAEIKPLETEIKYLKDMLRFVGTIAKRENAINTQYKELYPGFNVQSPQVRKIGNEYTFIKEDIRKDKDEWQYFKNYFTQLTNIPSTSNTALLLTETC